MSTVQELVAATIAFIRAANSLSTEVMLHADRSTLKPGLPFLTIKVTAGDMEVGLTPWLEYKDTDFLTITGERTANVSVQGFGGETYAWLEQAGLQLANPTIIDLNHANFCTIRCLGAVRDMSAINDTYREPRYAREFAMDYKLQTDPIAFTPVAEVVLADLRLERYAGAPDAIVDTITVTF